MSVTIVPDYNMVISLSDHDDIRRSCPSAPVLRTLKRLGWLAEDGSGITEAGKRVLTLWLDRVPPPPASGFPLGDFAPGVEAVLRDLLTDCAVTVPACVPKVGDVLASSWGYEQTNISWYRVVRVTKASVVIERVRGRVVRSDEYNDYMAPTDAPYGGTSKEDQKRTVRFKASADGYSVTINSYAHASLWDGEPMRQTGAAYGH